MSPMDKRIAQAVCIKAAVELLKGRTVGDFIDAAEAIDKLARLIYVNQVRWLEELYSEEQEHGKQ